MMLGAMLAGYFAAAPGNPLASRLGTLKDRVSGKAPVGKKASFKFTFSMATLKKLVEALKLTRGEEAQSTADKLLKAGYRSREALVIYMGIRLAAAGGPDQPRLPHRRHVPSRDGAADPVGQRHRDRRAPICRP